MLTRQLASAGSGKTYTLARQFIRFLISTKPENESRRLRTDKELKEAASHILAITFTNKATAEMKERIVGKLADLANAGDSDKPDYMKEFVSELNVGAGRISRACGIALDYLLNDFSSFNVTTIDSFFQSVLRTFAYETDLNDNYSVEIGTEALSALGMETTLTGMSSEVASGTAAGPVVGLLMKVNHNNNNIGWNLFQRRESRHSAYTRLLKSFSNIDNDRFRESFDNLYRFFFDSDPARIVTLYETLEKRSETPVDKAWQRTRNAAIRLRDLFEDNGLDLKTHGCRSLASHINRALEPDWRTSFREVDKLSISDSSKFKTFYKGAEQKKLDKNVDLTERIIAAGREFYDSFNHYRSLTKDPRGAFLNWQIFKPNLPPLGLLLIVNKFIRSYTAEHNLVQLGDTSSILNSIIGDDDTPFIYERLGTRLDHFLIDEFQDTSRMQWNNLLPLLRESESKGNENLIIGDAKQSIYRFRNADSSIITKIVPALFADSMRDAGNRPEENTNWRSQLRIVRFNNLLFHFLARQLGETFEELYSNTVQPPHLKEDRGYVEINILPKGSVRQDDEEEETGFIGSINPGRIVAELRGRGYRFRDIAFLVRTNAQGEEVINSLIAYNNSLGPGEEKIEFVSEESLKIESSVAVRTIVAALQAINSGAPFRKPGFPSARMVEEEAEHEMEIDLGEMLRTMQSVALPALVEAIAEKCVAPELLRDEAPFIAAFQDEISQYCESFPTDIASFLKWWDERSKKSAINSPEDTDAVRVMTIHKSKGLEFDCVIIPSLEVDFNTRSSGSWTWVEPVNVWGDDMELPELLPINISKDLEGTFYAGYLRDFIINEAVDKLNSTYVALTRAVKELYIFMPAPGKFNLENPEKNSGTTLRAMMLDLCTNMDGILADTPEGLREFMPREGEIKELSAGRFAFGVKEEQVDGAPTEKSAKALKAYRINGSIPLLQFKETDERDDTVPAETEVDDEDEFASDEAREEGNRFHAVMSNISDRNDLTSALNKVRRSGMIDEAWIFRNREFLEKAIRSVEDRGWFSPGLRVLKERPIAFRNGRSGTLKIRRPDRVVITPDNRGIIIDYKFGAPRTSHRRQILEYGRLLKEGLPGLRDVECYLWYMSEGVIKKV